MSIITKPTPFVNEGSPLTEDQLKLRSFLLSSFWRNDIGITDKTYRFCDHWIANEDGDIESKENADVLIKERYDTFK